MHMPAIHRFQRPGASAPLAFADDFGILSAAGEREREDAVWSDLPIPVSVTLPIDDAPAGEVVLPVHYEPRYAYPLLMWLNPARDVDFRDRVSAISDRNFIALALHWPVFAAPPTPSVSRTAECAHRIADAVAAANVNWNIHSRRHYLIAEGHSPCAWAIRLAEHSPERFDAFVCIRPERWRASRTLAPKTWSNGAARLLAIFDAAATHGESGKHTAVIDSWRHHAAGRNWPLDCRLTGEGGEHESAPSSINAWLMARIASC
jgi:hypothetical protein